MKWFTGFVAVLWISDIVGTALEILRYNEGLKNVPDDINASVSKLYLNDNHISTIRQSDFNDKFPFLEYLGLNGNNISTIEDGSFKGTKLRSINLNGNQLTRVPDLSEVKDTLDTLSLISNPITRINQTDFNDKFPALGVLYLEKNGITSIEDGCFRGAPIYSLRLIQNSLTAIPDLHEIRTTLKELRLYENKITAIRASDFEAGFDKLHRLQLYSNEITTIEPGSFNGLPALSRLDLHLNSIPFLRSSDFKHLQALETLKISSNPFKYIPSLNIATLTEVQAEALDIYCCQSASWLMNVTTLNDDHLKCIAPEKWMNASFSAIAAIELQAETCCKILV